MDSKILRALTLTFLMALPAHAASLQVTPVTLDVPEPSQSATIHLRNLGDKRLSSQLRVFRWSQQGGADRLEPAAEVAVSPPAIALEPGADYAVRVVRLDRAPVQGELSYRLLVDELPDPDRARNGSVALVVRYSIPVFFTAATAGAPHINWSVERSGGKVALVARNDGERRLRLADVSVSDGAGHRVSFGSGLVGYVLGGSVMRFTPHAAKSALASSGLRVSAMTDLGPIHGAIDQH